MSSSDKIESLIQELQSLKTQVKKSKPRKVSTWQTYLKKGADLARQKQEIPTRERVYQYASELASKEGYVKLKDQQKKKKSVEAVPPAIIPPEPIQ